MHARAVAVWCVLFAVVGMAGCAAPPGPAEESPVTATLRLHSGEASVETAEGDSAGSDGDILVAGDVVSVSGGEALVELRWSDGAVTRLGPGTTFTVGEPTERLGARGVQSGGVSWNRVPSAEADALPDAVAPYVLAIDGASPVSDRGELFVIDCRGETCRIGGTGGNGADGSKTTFRRGEIETEVEAEKPVSWEALMVDAWAEENAALDEAGGLVPVADLFVDAEPARGVLEGTYDVSLTRGARSCTGACDQLTGLNSGTSRQLVYSFRRQCDPSAGCSTAVETQSINTHTGDVIDDTVPLVTDAETFTWGTDQEVPICQWTYDVGTTTLTGRADNRIRWSVSPTAAEMRDGVYVITELEGSTDSYLKIIEHVDSLQFPGCETLEVEWTSGADMKLTRRAS